MGLFLRKTPVQGIFTDYTDREAALRGGLGECALGLIGERGKAGRIVDGEVGQNLAIQVDSPQLKTVDKLRIADPVELGGGADADDPEPAELALLLLAADVGEFETAFNGFLGCL